MRILVIGGTQFMGPFVVRRLAQLGHTVAVFHRGQTETDLPGEVSHIHGDNESILDFRNEFEKFRPDVALDMTQGSGRTTTNMMSSLRGIVSRVVVASSGDVYRAYGRLHRTEPGPPDPMPLSEDAPLREKFGPEHNENNEKIDVERVVMSDPELPGTILRLSAVYGQGDPQHRLYPYLKRMDDGRPFILLKETQAVWRWTRAYVENIAAGIILCIEDERAADQIYNLGELNISTESEWVRSIAAAANWDGEIIAVSDELLPLPTTDFRQQFVMESTRIRDQLGYEESVTHAEGIRRTVEWQRATIPGQDYLERLQGRDISYAEEDRILEQIK